MICARVMPNTLLILFFKLEHIESLYLFETNDNEPLRDFNKVCPLFVQKEIK